MKFFLVLILVLMLAGTASNAAASPRRLNTNPIVVAVHRAASHWGHRPCDGRITVDVVTNAPLDYGGVGVLNPCSIQVGSDSWTSWFGIEQTFPEFCELVSYGYGELLGAIGEKMAMTPQCAYHATFWWRGRRYWSWYYRGASYFSAQYYPTRLAGV